MNRFITCTSIAVLLSVAPALAADDANTMQSQPGASSEAVDSMPAQAGTTPEVAKEATQPDEGSADTSTGAAQQSSAPPSSGAASAGDASGAAMGGDQSTGAKEQSSAPEGSSAADTSKPNPTIGAGSSPSDTSQE